MHHNGKIEAFIGVPRQLNMPTRRKRAGRAIRRVTSALIPARVKAHFTKRKRVAHALKILEKYSLPPKAKRECAIALSEIGNQMDRVEAAQKNAKEVPLVFRKKEATPNQRKLVKQLDHRVEAEMHQFRVRLWKLILELGNGNEERGKKLTANVIAEFERSFAKPMRI